MFINIIHQAVRPIRRVFPAIGTLSLRPMSSSASSIQALQQAFRDPSSPFYLAEGEIGPASPDEPRTTTISTTPTTPILSRSPKSVSNITSSIQGFSNEIVKEARDYALKNGYDPDSFYEHKVMWGEIDSFRHVNNVQYGRYIECSRLQWLTSVYHQVGGSEAVNNFLSTQGICLILKSIFINYKRPIVYPDTILIAHRLVPVEPPSITRFKHEAIVYSYTHRSVAATGESVLVWYDYDKLQKSPPSDAMQRVLEDRMKKQEEQKKQGQLISKV